MLTNNYSSRCVNRLLLFSLAAVLILSGCAPQASSSTSIAATSSTPIDSTSYPPSSYYVPPESNSTPISTSWDLSPSVPGGLYAVTDKNDLSGEWYHMTGPVVEGYKNYVYAFRFHDEGDNSIYLNYTIWESGGGGYFVGEYTLGADGVLTATLKLSDYVVPEDTPLVHVTILAQKSNEAQNLCVFTIQSISTESEPFISTFSSLLNVPVAYVLYPEAFEE